MRNAMTIVAVLLVCSTAAAAQEARFRDLFELETMHVPQVESFAAAVDVAAIVAHDNPIKPSAVELSAWLNSINQQGIGDELPEWIDPTRHLVTVRLVVELPEHGVYDGSLLDCQVQPLDGRSPIGLLVPQSPLTTRGETLALVEGTVAEGGAIANGAQMKQGYLPNMCMNDAGRKWLTFRLKEYHGWGTSAATVTQAVERLQSDLQAQYDDLGSVDHPVRAIGLQRIQLCVPKSYEQDVIKFAYEVGEMHLVSEEEEPSAPPRPLTPSLQARAEFEASYKKRIESGLSYIAGVKVEVSAQGAMSGPEEYQPKELHASIAIPRDYVREIALLRTENDKLTAEQEESAAKEVKLGIERFVTNLLPRLSLGEDEYRQVEVTVYDTTPKVSQWSMPNAVKSPARYR
ncbi:hypothetical protein [Aeoliella mucimassa]|uniref:Uncharacterized protein n=1 Tax=Aeoliella mucimassa TaxID=2527972 RepID=A0A518AH25_9BACT|nr:hypothetical protein [Aeoliella mucimassa]QDU54026.1 hypothetical protein Pan181_02060 [Aeoliella mucimassa]